MTSETYGGGSWDNPDHHARPPRPAAPAVKTEAFCEAAGPNGWTCDRAPHSDDRHKADEGPSWIVDMTYDQHWTAKCAYARLPEDYPGQAGDAATIARLMVQEGVGYSYGSYPALAAWHWGLSTPRLEAWIGRRREPTVLKGSTPDGPQPWPWVVSLPVEAICSVFADQAWSLTGKKIFQDGRPHQCVTPSQLGQRLLFGLENVTWGWPASHPYP
jgi:hypothetical protein